MAQILIVASDDSAWRYTRHHRPQTTTLHSDHIDKLIAMPPTPRPLTDDEREVLAWQEAQIAARRGA